MNDDDHETMDTMLEFTAHDTEVIRTDSELDTALEYALPADDLEPTLLTLVAAEPWTAHAK